MRAHFLGLLLATAACAPEFIEPWEVTKPRHMVAKVSIDGDVEGRSRPRAGETFSIHLYMMSPERPQASYSADEATCVGTVLPDGTLACYEELPFADLTLADYQNDDRIELRGFTIPPELEQLPPPFDQIDRISLFGSVCVDGQIERVPGKTAKHDPISTLFQCVDNEESPFPTQLPFTMSVWLDREGVSSVNHHPSFACDDGDPSGPCHEGVEHDGEKVPGSFVLSSPEAEAGDAARSIAWQAWDFATELPWDACADAGESLPKVRAGSKAYKIYARFDASDRETYERTIEVNGEPTMEKRREELIINHALTTKGGSLDGYGSVVYFDADDADAEIEIEYTPARQSDEKEKQIPDGGRLVRFYFGLRDQRGGVDFVTRELCLLPPDD